MTARITTGQGRAVRWTAWLLLDLALITVFAASGRNTHQHGLTGGGILATAAPFLVACLLAWAATRAWRTPQAIWPTGVLIWLVTALGGLLIRALFGGGMAFSFQIVAVLVLGALLLLPRAVDAALRHALRKRRRKPGKEQHNKISWDQGSQ